MERLTADGAATHLHYDAELGGVWLDTDIGEGDGLVVGMGETRDKALADARTELHARIADLDAAIAHARRNVR